SGRPGSEGAHRSAIVVKFGRDTRILRVNHGRDGHPHTTQYGSFMNNPNRRLWLRALLLTGVLYCTIGIVFSAFAARSSHRIAVVWNFASFGVSLIAFAIHIGYEHFSLHNRPLIVGLHTALAVALGAFLLAVSANIRSIGVAT